MKKFKWITYKIILIPVSFFINVKIKTWAIDWRVSTYVYNYTKRNLAEQMIYYEHPIEQKVTSIGPEFMRLERVFIDETAAGENNLMAASPRNGGIFKFTLRR